MAPQLRFPSKDPAEVLDYGFTWGNRLDEGETIVASTWVIDGVGGLTVNSTEIGLVTNRLGKLEYATKVWLSGGSVGEKYTLRNHVTSSKGKVWEESGDLYVVDKSP